MSYPDQSQIITRILKKEKWETEKTLRDGWVRMTLLALMDRAGDHEPRNVNSLSCKRQGNGIPLSASQRNADHLIIVQGDFEILTSRTARSINLCCFKLLGLQSFVIATTRNSYTSTEDSRAKERQPCVPMILESCHPSPGWLTPGSFYVKE